MEDVSTCDSQTRNLGLRPIFEELLGAKVVDDFTEKAWKRSVVGIHAKSEYRNGNRPNMLASKKNDGKYVYDHQRFDALGPILQCPPPILSKFGKGDDEKRVCGLPANLLGQSASNAKSCTIISIGGRNQWDFELNISEALPNCHIHTLDCTIDGVVPAALVNKVTFHKICIGTENINVTIPAKNKFITNSSSNEVPGKVKVLQYMP